MVYNYFVKPGENFNIKTPGIKSFNDINSILKSDGEININHSLYPNGFEIKMVQMPDKINITTNMELIKKDDGFYYIKEN